jgi:hypothetical protein
MGFEAEEGREKEVEREEDMEGARARACVGEVGGGMAGSVDEEVGLEEDSSGERGGMSLALRVARSKPGISAREQQASFI